MKFSIIVPVYNVADYIEKCLNSVICQDFDDYEIIVVDDESPDNSMEIVENFAKKDPSRFQIVHQKNKGLGGARNTGASVANGQYLFFIDSDDYIEPKTLSKISKMLDENPCDILMFQYNEVLLSGEIIGKQMHFSKDTFFAPEDQKEPLILLPPCAWNKIFRKDFYLSCNTLFPEKTLYEDGITRILTAKAKSIYVCADHFYNYVQRPGSIMNSKVSPRVLDIVKITDIVYDAFIQEGLMDQYKSSIEAALIQSAFYVIEGIYEKEKSNPLLKQILDYIVSKFPNYQKNPLLLHQSRKIHLLSEGKYFQYNCIKAKERLKSTLYKNPILFKLNSLRKAIRK